MALSRLLAILRRANGWHRFFAGRPDEKGFFDAVDAAIRMGMGKAYSVGTGFIGKTAVREPVPHGGQDWEKVRRAWEKARQEFDPALWGTAGQSAGEAVTAKDPKHLGKALWAAHHAEAAMVARAQHRLDKLLEKPAGLDPHFALYLNFLRQYGFAQARLNALTGRHLDFYYHYILEESPLPPVPDRIYFALQTESEAGPFYVAGGGRAHGQGCRWKGRRLSNRPSAGSQRHRPCTNLDRVPGRTAFPSREHRGCGRREKAVGAPGAVGAVWRGRVRPMPPCRPVLPSRPRSASRSASPYLHLEEGKRSIRITFTFDGARPAKSAEACRSPRNSFTCRIAGPRTGSPGEGRRGHWLGHVHGE